MGFSLFGINVSFGKNGKYVKTEECHEAHEKLTGYLDRKFNEIKDDTNTRINDLQISIENYIKLLIK